MKNFLKTLHHGSLYCLIGAIFVEIPATIFFPDIYSADHTMNIILGCVYIQLVSYVLRVLLYAERRD